MVLFCRITKDHSLHIGRELLGHSLEKGTGQRGTAKHAEVPKGKGFS